MCEDMEKTIKIMKQEAYVEGYQDGYLAATNELKAKNDNKKITQGQGSNI
jgi:hypothetical protein